MFFLLIWPQNVMPVIALMMLGEVHVLYFLRRSEEGLLANSFLVFNSWFQNLTTKTQLHTILKLWSLNSFWNFLLFQTRETFSYGPNSGEWYFSLLMYFIYTSPISKKLECCIKCQNYLHFTQSPNFFGSGVVYTVPNGCWSTFICHFSIESSLGFPIVMEDKGILHVGNLLFIPQRNRAWMQQYSSLGCRANEK